MTHVIWRGHAHTLSLSRALSPTHTLCLIEVTTEHVQQNTFDLLPLSLIAGDILKKDIHIRKKEIFKICNKACFVFTVRMPPVAMHVYTCCPTGGIASRHTYFEKRPAFRKRDMKILKRGLRIRKREIQILKRGVFGVPCSTLWMVSHRTRWRDIQILKRGPHLRKWDMHFLKRGLHICGKDTHMLKRGVHFVKETWIF